MKQDCLFHFFSYRHNCLLGEETEHMYLMSMCPPLSLFHTFTPFLFLFCCSAPRTCFWKSLCTGNDVFQVFFFSQWYHCLSCFLREKWDFLFLCGFYEETTFLILVELRLKQAGTGRSWECVWMTGRCWGRGATELVYQRRRKRRKSIGNSSQGWGELKSLKNTHKSLWKGKRKVIFLHCKHW